MSNPLENNKDKSDLTVEPKNRPSGHSHKRQKSGKGPVVNFKSHGGGRGKTAIISVKVQTKPSLTKPLEEETRSLGGEDVWALRVKSEKRTIGDPTFSLTTWKKTCSPGPYCQNSCIIEGFQFYHCGRQPLGRQVLVDGFAVTICCGYFTFVPAP